jgi:hypothetical protein
MTVTTDTHDPRELGLGAHLIGSCATPPLDEETWEIPWGEWKRVLTVWRWTIRERTEPFTPDSKFAVCDGADAWFNAPTLDEAIAWCNARL